MGDNSFAPYSSLNTFFVVENTSPQQKTIKIFNYPINLGSTRDLMQIPGVGEADIRVSLLKGELRNKILAQDIVIISTNIDLLQFDPLQLQFLLSAGVNYGTSQTPTNQQYTYYQNVALSGTINGSNTVFTIPNGQYFVQNSSLKIVVYWNGVKQVLNDDYTVGLVSGGYQNVILTVPPTVQDVMTADYYVENY